MNRWVPAALLAAAVYFLISGLLLAELAGRAPSLQIRFAWRMTSWVIGALAITAHFAWEQLRLRSTPIATALHVSCGVGIGMSALAASALIRALVTGTGRPELLGVAIVLWPLVGGVPTFLVTLAAGSVLRRVQSSPGP
jgi:hypothetical protein